MKIILVLNFLFLTFIVNAQTNNSSYWKTYTEPNGIQHSLSVASKNVVHLFDAMPKYWLYKYSGSENLKKEYADLLKAKNLIVHYPTFINSHQEFAIEVLIHTDKDKYMTVELTDLNVADKFAQREIKKIQIESDALADKLGYAKTKIEFTPSKPTIINNHNTMYNVAVATNLNYSIDEKRGIRPYEVQNFQKGYVSFDESDHSGFYTSLIKDRYLVTIKLNDVKTLKDCKSVEDYILEYLSKFNLEILSNNN